MQRINGLDFARLLAFAGMVIVNFQVVMTSADVANFGLFNDILVLFEGKAAATFVVLAGIGTTYAYQRDKRENFGTSMLKRALFLLVIGLLNMTIFSADIIHYYAFYFLIGLWLLPLSKRLLLVITAAIILAFPVLVVLFNYDAGWNWSTLSYLDFWTPLGFARNLMFNGWHPIIPWLAFFSFGVFLAKTDLTCKANAWRLVGVGAIGVIAIPLLSKLLISVMTPIAGTKIATILSTSPIPPGPLYMLNGICAAILVIGLCLLLPSTVFQNTFIKTLCRTGQMALTLYFAHIVIGMGIIDALGLVSSTTALGAFWAANCFVAASIVFTYVWRTRFRRGPIEELMRLLTK